MDKKVKKAVEEFVSGAKKLGIEKIILYGSAARGGYVPNESDIDILIVGKRHKKTYGKLLDIQADVSLKYNAAFSVIMKTVKEFQNEGKMGSPFIENVVKEGELLYGKEDIGAGA
jgi:predicted nucleotidyltransferase